MHLWEIEIITKKNKYIIYIYIMSTIFLKRFLDMQTFFDWWVDGWVSDCFNLTILIPKWVCIVKRLSMTIDSIYWLLSQNNPPATSYHYTIAILNSIIYNAHIRLGIWLIPIFWAIVVSYYCRLNSLNRTKILLHD